MKKVTLKFRKKERGFTLIELLIVIAILGVLAAVVVPNVMGLFGKGGSQAYETDKSTIQTSVATFWGDVHVGPFDNDPAAGFDWRWGSTNAGAKPAGHYFPTEDGLASSIIANTAVTDAYGNPRMDVGAAAATDAQITSAAIWMGLLVNPAAAGADPGSASRNLAAPLTDESDLYLNDIAQSCSTPNNGNIGTGGTYTWIVGANGKVYGAYYDSAAVAWYAGFGGSYP